MTTNQNRSSRLPDIKEIEVDRNPFPDQENEQSRLMRQPLMPVAEGLNKEDIKAEQSHYDVSVELREADERKSSAEQVDPDEYCVILNRRDSGFVTVLKILAMVVLSPIWIPLVFLKLIWELVKLTASGIKATHKKKPIRRFFKWIGLVWIVPFFKGLGHTFKGSYLLVETLVVRPIIWIFAKIIILAATFWLDHMGKAIVYTLIGLYKVSLFVFMIVAFLSVHFAIGIKYSSITTWNILYFVLVHFCTGLGHSCLTIGRGVRFWAIEFGRGIYQSSVSIVKVIQMNAVGMYHTLKTTWRVLAFLVVENAKGFSHSVSSLWQGWVFLYSNFEFGCFHTARALYYGVIFTLE